ncbi:HAD family hydrolase [Halopiger goleimassiliensis]|uniref:HAD family hydrolase n=1 Tax=Halopiger goleimassiliensis TaxID=1293048 RepID=UPI0006777723|nr:HAD family hydrolase [Halopiger goleimassiliensis]
MPEIEAVTLDLDGTLVRYRRTPGEVLRTSYERLGIEPLFSVEEYYARYDEFAAKHESMAAMRSDCFATLAAENGFDRDLGREVAAAFDEVRDQSNVERRPGVERVLDALAETYRLGIVTNGTADAQRRKIDAAGLERWTDAVVVAGAQGAPKPAPDPFERALTALEATPEMAVHVGDSLETDVVGANRAGLDSAWLSDGTDPGAHEPTYRLDELGDLVPEPWLEE